MENTYNWELTEEKSLCAIVHINDAGERNTPKVSRSCLWMLRGWVMSNLFICFPRFSKFRAITMYFMIRKKKFSKKEVSHIRKIFGQITCSKSAVRDSLPHRQVFRGYSLFLLRGSAASGGEAGFHRNPRGHQINCLLVLCVHLSRISHPEKILIPCSVMKFPGEVTTEMPWPWVGDRLCKWTSKPEHFWDRKKAIDYYARTAGISWDCPGQTRTFGHPSKNLAHM